MDIKLGQVYFYQSLQFAMTGFLRPFSRIHTQYNGVDNYRVGVANFFNLHDAIDTPLYEKSSEYENLKEDGTLTNLWVLDESYLKSDNVILIPIDKMSDPRYKTINTRGRRSNKLTIAIGMDEDEVISYMRNKKISNIFDEKE